MSKRVPVRILIKYKGISRKFFTLLESPDGSLYIHPYRPFGQPWKIPGTQYTDESKVLLDFAESVEPDFELNKITFHQSGYIHLTNNAGNRYRDGIIGSKFTDIVEPYFLCALVPCEIEHLPQYSEDKKCMAVTLELPDEIEPFYLIITLAKESHEIEGFNETMLFTPIVLPLRSEYKITFVLRSVLSREKGESVEWPPFPFFLIRTGA